MNRWHEDEDGCWIWKGITTARGIPTIHTSEGQSTAARLVWQRERGPIPEGHVLVNLCGIRLCVAPDHRAPLHRSRLPQYRAERLLTRPLAERIQELHRRGMSGRALGRLYAIDERLVRNIVKGEHWTVRNAPSRKPPTEKSTT